VQGQRSLEEHEDGSPYSFVLALNSGFQAGGTTFTQLDGAPTILPNVGDAVVFHGRNRHAGAAITHGTRYILAGFLRYADQEFCRTRDPAAVFAGFPGMAPPSGDKKKRGGRGR
jgi:hypothetical protein